MFEFPNLVNIRCHRYCHKEDNLAARPEPEDAQSTTIEDTTQKMISSPALVALTTEDNMRTIRTKIFNLRIELNTLARDSKFSRAPVIVKNVPGLAVHASTLINLEQYGRLGSVVSYQKILKGH